MKAVAMKGVSIALACRAFDVSETCYRYSPKLDNENEQIADLLLGLTTAKKAWGFGLCFLYLRNVQGHGWNHKRVYRIYRELELNLRIKPRKRLKREKPDELAVPEAPNEVWSMDFMADRLEDGRQFRLLNVLDDFNREVTCSPLSPRFSVSPVQGLMRYPTCSRPLSEFPPFDQVHGLVSCADFISSAGTLCPMALCGRSSL